MFTFKVATILAVSAAVLAEPSRLARGDTCSTGMLHCCDSVSSVFSESGNSGSALTDLLLRGLGIPTGINCNPITVIGHGSSASCKNQVACCSGVGESNVGLDCSPINAAL